MEGSEWKEVYGRKCIEEGSVWKDRKYLKEGFKNHKCKKC